MTRGLLGIAAVGSCLAGPWWLTLVLIARLSMLYTAWEVPLIGLMADLIWRPALGALHPLPLMLIASLVVVWICEPIRRRVFLS